MSDKENCGTRDFSKYDEMTTEELEEILRLDAENTEGQESDTETLLYIMGVLTERRKNNGHTGNTAQESYESFKQHYVPELIDNTSLTPEKDNKRKNRNLPWMRGLVAAVVVIAILVFGSVTAKAFGVDLWNAVVQWTQEAFHFGDKSESPNEGNVLPYASLQEVLEQDNVTLLLVPTWFPDGYELADISVEHNPMKIKYRAIYSNREQVIKITVQDYLGEDPLFVEQSEGLVEEYVVSGITYYLVVNNKQVRATWVNDSYVCDISGEVTIDELKQMIDSIQKG